MRFSVLVYGSNCLEVTPEEVSTIRADQGTDFVVAYAGIAQVLQRENRSDLAIVFMTDGQHQAGSNEEQGRRDLTLRLNAHSCDSTVHVIGLGASHDFNRMNALTTAGKTQGSYRYLQNGSAEGAATITDAVCEMAGWASNTLSATMEIDGVVHTVSLERNDSGGYGGSVWLQTAPSTQHMTLHLSGQMPLDVDVDTTEPDHMFELRRILRESATVRTRADVEALQQRYHDCSPFTNSSARLTHEQRRCWLELATDVQDTLNQCFKILGDAARMKGDEALAMFRQLQFQATFTKARRQRTMHQRAMSAEGVAERVMLELETVHKAAQHSCDASCTDGQFQCDVSQYTAHDLLVETHDDLLGFGITVSRSEVSSVDAPALMVVCSLSSTMISLQTFLDAARHSASSRGLEATLGSIGSGATLSNAGQVMVGRGREVINAWVPMYVNEQHAERAAIMLPLICGHLWTLETRGYDRRQVLALFSLAGQMHQMAVAAGTERARMLAGQFSLLCGHLKLDKPVYGLSQGDLLEVEDFLGNFVESTEAREKARVSTLHLVTGHCAAVAARTGQSYDCVLASVKPALAAEAARRMIASLAGAMRDLRPQIRCMMYGDAAAAAPEVQGTAHGADYGSEDAWIQWLQNGCVDTQVPTMRGPTLPAYESRAQLAQLDCTVANELFQEAVSTRPGWEVALCEEVFGSDEQVFAAVMLQAMVAYRNDDYRHLCAQKRAMANPFDADTRCQLVNYVHLGFEKTRKERFNAAQGAVIDEELATFVAHETQSVAHFAAMLRHLCPARGGSVFAAVRDAVLGVGTDDPQALQLCVPAAAQKIAFIVTGMVPVHGRVLSPWAAGPQYAQCVRRMLSELAPRLLVELEELMGETVVKHEYRWSDIPNRHGHCTSNPNPLLCHGWDI
eukprot:TRINITY_DN10479_c0_g1_i2.p1 TRINITY_DN10479_c0_g1~~TRINITY_DN10479_c0_g1_i2.p1  ORF type:complete len:908 (+),score=210.31 TRINITY_DN10479_c0_g1_i2:97-2820(+)